MRQDVLVRFFILVAIAISLIFFAYYINTYLNADISVATVYGTVPTSETGKYCSAGDNSCASNQLFYDMINGRKKPVKKKTDTNSNDDKPVECKPYVMADVQKNCIPVGTSKSLSDQSSAGSDTSTGTSGTAVFPTRYKAIKPLYPTKALNILPTTATAINFTQVMPINLGKEDINNSLTEKPFFCSVIFIIGNYMNALKELGFFDRENGVIKIDEMMKNQDKFINIYKDNTKLLTPYYNKDVDQKCKQFSTAPKSDDEGIYNPCKYLFDYYYNTVFSHGCMSYSQYDKFKQNNVSNQNNCSYESRIDPFISWTYDILYMKSSVMCNIIDTNNRDKLFNRQIGTTRNRPLTEDNYIETIKKYLSNGIPLDVAILVEKEKVKYTVNIVLVGYDSEKFFYIAGGTPFEMIFDVFFQQFKENICHIIAFM